MLNNDMHNEISNHIIMKLHAEFITDVLALISIIIISNNI